MKTLNELKRERDSMKRRRNLLNDKISQIEEAIESEERKARNSGEQARRDLKMNILSRVMAGETMSDIARSMSVTPPTVRFLFHQACRIRNLKVYKAGRANPNYCDSAPSLKYLLEHRIEFGC